MTPNKSYLICGDVGLGFQGYPYPEKFPDNIKFIAGNHDNPSCYKKHPNYLGDYGFIKEIDLFYISGAWSIDYQLRTPGVDWWENEELSYTELQKAIELYKECKPKYMVSHDCPLSVSNNIFHLHWKDRKQSRTSLALDEMFKSWQPEQWGFSHWHCPKIKIINETKFVALDMFIDTDDYLNKLVGKTKQDEGVSYEIEGIGWNGKTE
jgi:hypothetical protein